MKSATRMRMAISGFTVLEALIATAMMALVLITLTSLTAQWLPNWNRGFLRLQNNELAALGLDRIIADLGAAQFIRMSPDQREPLFEGTTNSVVFVRTLIGPNSTVGLEIVQIGETNTSEGLTTVRMRTPYHRNAKGIVNIDRFNFADPVVLIRPPYRLALSYAGKDKVWRAEWKKQNQLPRTIKLSLHSASLKSTFLSTAVMLHASLPQECITAKSIDECFSAPSLTRPSGSAEPDGSRS